MKSVLRRFISLGGFHGTIVMFIYRTGNIIFYKIKLPVIRHILLALHLFIDYLVVRTFLGCEFPAQCRIGKNLNLPHGGKGIILEKSVIIGDNVRLYHQVTIGMKNKHSPIIGDGVLIGAGAKILGGVSIGNGASIGANAVVLQDIPDHATAIGIPAKIKT